MNILLMMVIGLEAVQLVQGTALKMDSELWMDGCIIQQGRQSPAPVSLPCLVFQLQAFVLGIIERHPAEDCSIW